MLTVGATLTAGRSAAPLNAAETSVQFLVEVWDTENGLPQNEVAAILQTRAGYLWLGTASGLTRFDGFGFRVFDEGNTPGLKSSRVIGLFEDSFQRLWIGTDSAGVAILKDGEIQSVPRMPGGREGRMLGACQDPGGAVWVYLANGQVWRFKGSAHQVFAVGAGQATDYHGIIAEPGGAIWIGGDRRLLSINWNAAQGAPGLPIQKEIPAANLQYLLPSRTGGYWALDGRILKWKSDREMPEVFWGFYPWAGTSARLTSACEDRDGHLILGTSGQGVYWYDDQTNAVHICTTNSALSNDFVSALHVDREGDLWVGTDGGGLNRLKRPLFHVVDSTRDSVIQSVSPDDQGGLWIVQNGGPFTYWKGGVQRSVGLGAKTVFVDRQQRVWAGTHTGGLRQIQGSQLRAVPGFDTSVQVVFAIHQDRHGRIWVGTERGVRWLEGTNWATLATPGESLSGTVQALADDLQGRLWIGTDGDGLACWDKGQLTQYRKQADGLPSDHVSALWADGNGVLWVGTDGGGLARLRDGQWKRYTRESGLASNSIGYIIEDSTGSLWFGSNAGLMRASKTSLNDFAEGRINFVPCRIYGRSDGLPVRECSFASQPGPGRSHDGRLWFPTIRGLAVIDPASLKANPNPPPVMIESIRIDGRLQRRAELTGAGDGSFSVPSGSEDLEIQYSSLNLSAPDRARFRYKLEGSQSEWTEAGTRREAHYQKLPPGSYTFHVIACNEDGVWNEAGATFAFMITPPFWKTWWFAAGTAVALLASVGGLVHYFSTQRLQRQLLQLRQQEALEKERSRIARDIHDQVGASLTQVALLGELVEGDREDPEEVEAHARQISQTARETTRVLDEIVWAVNPANDTLEGLVTYICKYTQEYFSVAGLHYRLDVPEHLPAASIPPEVRHNVYLASKEAVTNVVKHAKATAARLRLKVQPGRFILEIEDNGRGLSGLDHKAASSRNGLRNMRQRMEEIQGEFSFAPGPEGGTLVRFSVPIDSQ